VVPSGVRRGERREAKKKQRFGAYGRRVDGRRNGMQKMITRNDATPTIHRQNQKKAKGRKGEGKRGWTFIQPVRHFPA